MRIAVLSDIHGNYAALEACCDYLSRKDIDGIIFLGDYVSDCPYPQKTMSLLYGMLKRYKSWCVRGNREEYMIGHHHRNAGWKYSSGSGSLLYTYENLSVEDICFFEKCQKCFRINIDGCAMLTVCHGSPASTREELHSGTDLTNKYLSNLETDYLLCGHTHKRLFYSYDGKTIINPGSVGIQTNNQTKSQFAILNWDNSAWQPEFISVDYDIDKMLNDFKASGLIELAPVWSKAICKTLLTGVNYAFLCLMLANEIAAESEPGCKPHDISEEHWNKAGRQLGII